MFWWIALAVVVTFGAAFLLKVTRASAVLGGMIATPLGWLLFRSQDTEASRAFTGAAGSLFAAFLSCLAGLALGSLILRHHTPREFYWILCAPVAGIALMVQFTLASHPVPQEQARSLLMEPWPNFVGSVGAIVACYFISGQWLA